MMLCIARMTISSKEKLLNCHSNRLESRLKVRKFGTETCMAEFVHGCMNLPVLQLMGGWEGRGF